MKKLYFVVALLALVMISTAAIAQKADKELCLTGISYDPKVAGSQHNTILSYTGLSNGHVLFYGETCYFVPAANGQPEGVGCLPMLGSGIFSENNLEFFLQGAEYTTDFGLGVLETATLHIMLSTDTLTGTYASEIVDFVEGERLEIFDSGTMGAVKCHAVSKSEIDPDKRFKQLIEKIDKFGTL